MELPLVHEAETKPASQVAREWLDQLTTPDEMNRSREYVRLISGLLKELQLAQSMVIRLERIKKAENFIARLKEHLPSDSEHLVKR